MNTKSCIEQLENRRLLSATLSNGILSVTGSMGDDLINVYRKIDDPTQITVEINGSASYFSLAATSKIVINGRRGNDHITGNMNPDSPLAHFDPLPALFAKGGGGNDGIEGGIHDDTLIGGDGNDWLDGGKGGDLLLGGAGADFLEGSAGNDIIKGGAGNDAFDGSTGNDYMKGGSGDDVMFGRHGYDSLFGGDGDDQLEMSRVIDKILEVAPTDKF